MSVRGVVLSTSRLYVTSFGPPVTGYVRFASSMLHKIASPLGTGAAGIGELYKQTTHTEAMEALWKGYHGGARIVDTAPYYGFGQSERRVGDFVREVIRERGYDASPRVSTKVGRLLTPVPADKHDAEGWVGGLQFKGHFDFSGPALERSVEDSLQRMGLPRDRVCSLVLHDLDQWHQTEESIEKHFAELKSSGAQALGQMRGAPGEGIEALGAGLNETYPEHVARFLDLQDGSLRPLLDFFLVAGRMSLFENAAPQRDALTEGTQAVRRTTMLKETLALLDARETAEHSVGILVGGAYASGLLAAPPRVLVAQAATLPVALGPPKGCDESVR